jgi:hypothetical protein
LQVYRKWVLAVLCAVATAVAQHVDSASAASAAATAEHAIPRKQEVRIERRTPEYWRNHVRHTSVQHLWSGDDFSAGGCDYRIGEGWMLG